MPGSDGLLFGTAGIPLTSREDSTLAGIERIRELGLGCMEVEFVRGINMGPEKALAVADAAARSRVRLSAHAPYFINLNAREPEKLASSRDRIIRTARTAAIFGGESVVVHAAYYLKDEPSEVYARVKENLESIREELHVGGNGVWIRPEVTGNPTAFGTLDEVLSLSAEVEGVAPAIDFPHWYARTGMANSYPEFAAILEELSNRLGRQALESMHIHVSGIEHGPRGERRHLPLADSDFRYADLLKALKEYSVSGLVICESPIRERDALHLQQVYEAI